MPELTWLPASAMPVTVVLCATAMDFRAGMTFPDSGTVSVSRYFFSWLRLPAAGEPRLSVRLFCFEMHLQGRIGPQAIPTTARDPAVGKFPPCLRKAGASRTKKSSVAETSGVHYFNSSETPAGTFQWVNVLPGLPRTESVRLRASKRL